MSDKLERYWMIFVYTAVICLVIVTGIIIWIERDLPKSNWHQHRSGQSSDHVRYTHEHPYSRIDHKH